MRFLDCIHFIDEPWAHLAVQTAFAWQTPPTDRCMRTDEANGRCKGTDGGRIGCRLGSSSKEEAKGKRIRKTLSINIVSAQNRERSSYLCVVAGSQRRHLVTVDGVIKEESFDFLGNQGGVHVFPRMSQLFEHTHGATTEYLSQAT